MPERALKTHRLKCDSVPFCAVWDGDKRAEFRKNDRDFRVGDYLMLVEINSTPEPVVHLATGRIVIAKVTHMIEGPSPYGIPEGFAMLSIKCLKRRVV